MGIPFLGISLITISKGSRHNVFKPRFYDQRMLLLLSADFFGFGLRTLLLETLFIDAALDGQASWLLDLTFLFLLLEAE